MIQIYKKDTTKFEKNGDMTLFPTKCKLSAKLNGSWVLDMIHPLDSMGRWKHIEEEAIIAAPTFMGKRQLFRIDELEKTDAEIEVTAYPIFFDSADDCFLLDRRPEIKNGQQALDIMTEGTKYRGESNISTSSTAYFVRRNLMDCINGEDSPTFVQRWGGEILYDNYKVIINERAGGDYGTEIRYGKNMDGISYKLDLSETITRILPVAYNGHTLPGDEPWVDSPLIGKYAKVYAKEMKFDDVKLLEDANEDDAENGIIVCATKEELYAALVKKCEEQFKLGVDLPKVTIDVNMVDLSNTEEYKEFESLEKVGLGDTVHCKHRILDITTDARCIELTWDCIRNVSEEMTLGEFEYDYFTEFSSTLQAVEKILGPNNTVMAERVQGVLNAINTQLRYQKNAAQRQDVRAILFEDLNEDSPMYGAMCLGTQGFQISNKRTADGRDWEWSTAFTAHGGYADTIISGTISDKKGRNYWNLDTGEFRLTSGAYIGDETIEDYVGNASDKSLSDFVNAVYNPKITELQKQIDGQIETFYYDYQPTLTNAPAVEWKTEEERKKHEGDLFYWKSKGYAYRFFKNGSSWTWQLVQDTDITNALAQAEKAQDTADNKRRVFVTTPKPPYDVGDLWAQGTSGDIMRCQTARESGNYVASDWVKASKYTDDSALKDFINGAFKDTVKDLESQNDKKAETWYQSADPSTNWTTTEVKNEHIGDMWFNTNTKKSSRWNGTKWEDMTTPVPDEVYDKIDGKAQVFVTTPEPPYDVGDLWAQGTSGDIMRCQTARESGNYVASDWVKASKYTDDSAVENLDEKLTQKEIFNRLTDNGNAQGIYMTDSELYINAEYMVAGRISDKRGMSYWDLETGEMKLTGTFEQRDADGEKSVDIYNNNIRFFDWTNNGNYVGSIGAVRRKSDGRVGVEMWCDQGDMLWIGYDDGSETGSHIKPIISFDSTKPNEPPFIANTYTGDFITSGVHVDVKNGLITNVPFHSTYNGKFRVLYQFEFTSSKNGVVMDSWRYKDITVINGTITKVEDVIVEAARNAKGETISETISIRDAEGTIVSNIKEEINEKHSDVT